MSSTKLFSIGAIRSYLLLNLLDMIEVVRKGCMNVSKRDAGNVRHNLVRRHALVLMPTDDVLHPHSVARNVSPSTADAGAFNDSLVDGIVCSHKLHVPLCVQNWTPIGLQIGPLR